MKIFKFRIEDLTYVRWNFGGHSIKDFLYTSFDFDVQNTFEMTLEFKRKLDAKLNNQPPTPEIRVEITKLLEILKENIKQNFKDSKFCGLFFESPFHFEFQILERTAAYNCQQNFLKMTHPQHKESYCHPELSIANTGDLGLVNDLLYEVFENNGKLLGVWDSMVIKNLTPTVATLKSIICLQILVREKNGYVPADLSLGTGRWQSFLRQIFENQEFKKSVFPLSTLKSSDYTLQMYSECAVITQLMRSLDLIDESLKVTDGHLMFPSLITNPFVASQFTTHILVTLKIDTTECQEEFEMFT